MCDFFSCLVTRTGDVLFTEDVTSHDTIIDRSGLEDTLENFIRVEYTPEYGYRIDEKTIPEWYERIAATAKEAVVATYNRIIPLQVKYAEQIERHWTAHILDIDPTTAKFTEEIQPIVEEYKNKLMGIKGYVGLTQ